MVRTISTGAWRETHLHIIHKCSRPITQSENLGNEGTWDGVVYQHTLLTLHEMDDIQAEV